MTNFQDVARAAQAQAQAEKDGSSPNEPIAEEASPAPTPRAPAAVRWGKLRARVVSAQPQKKVVGHRPKEAGWLQSVVNPHEDHHAAINEEDEHGKGIRSKIVRFVHAHSVQIFLLVLLFIDVICVIVELLLAQMEEATLHTKHDLCLNVTAAPAAHHGPSPPASSHSRWFDVLSGGGDVGGTQTESHGFFPNPGCGVFADLALPHDIHNAERALGWVSRVILLIFAAEFLALFFALRHKFFTIPYTLDALIVGVSLGLSFWELYGDTHTVGLEIIIILRLWRFCRVLHGFGMVVYDLEEEKREAIQEARLEFFSDFVHERLGDKGVEQLKVELEEFEHEAQKHASLEHEEDSAAVEQKL